MQNPARRKRVAEAKTKRPAFEFGGQWIGAGKRATIDVPISVLSTHTPMTLPVQVVHGRQDGPVMFVSAVVHGDEVLGVEIIRRLLRHRALRSLRGTLLAVPVVNSFGFISHSRYLPDRRDLNRSFPGREMGSLASMLADLFLREVVCRSDFGIDLHTAAQHRTNLPQIRIGSRDGRAYDLAMEFGAPVVLLSKLREGSLRQAARAEGVDVLVYEAGEALRFDETSVRIGMTGILRVMNKLGMLKTTAIKPSKVKPFLSSHSQWMRAPEGGLLRAHRQCGDVVVQGETIGYVADPFGEREWPVNASMGGIIVGRTNLPVTNRGDALFHIARIEKAGDAEHKLNALSEELAMEALSDDDDEIL